MKNRCRTIVVFVSFILSANLLMACSSKDDPSTPGGTAASEQVSGTEQTAGTELISGTEPAAGTELISDTEQIPGTEQLSDTEAVSSTEAADDTEKEFPVSGSADNTEHASNDSGFVLLAKEVPDVILEIRYYSTYNFIGDRIDGYEEPCAIVTKEAAQALRNISDDLKNQGYRLKIFDAYRPKSAVAHFVRWAKDRHDTRMKEYFYPDLDKSVLFRSGYISEKSGHSRGSTVDLTLFDMTTEKEVDMGGTFDYFGNLSHPSYTRGLTKEQIKNRQILRNAMIKGGFRPISTEWWHFTLENEPYPNTYFDFPVKSDFVVR